MTKFMKVELISLLVLKAFGYFCVCTGVIGIVGFPGGFQNGDITGIQFFLYELHAAGLVVLAIATYYLMEVIKADFVRRDSYLHYRKQFGV